jgi:hypothetical protein
VPNNALVHMLKLVIELMPLQKSLANSKQQFLTNNTLNMLDSASISKTFLSFDLISEKNNSTKLNFTKESGT